MKPSEILEEAAKRIEAGWWRGEEPKPEGHECPISAIYRPPIGDHLTERLAAERFVRDQLAGDRGQSRTDSVIEISRWNDAPERTKDEVLALMARAKFAAEAAGQ